MSVEFQIRHLVEEYLGSPPDSHDSIELELGMLRCVLHDTPALSFAFNFVVVKFFPKRVPSIANLLDLELEFFGNSENVHFKQLDAENQGLFDLRLHEANQMFSFKIETFDWLSNSIQNA